MPRFSRPTLNPTTTLAYVTGGALLCVWTLTWYFTRDYQPTRSQWFWVAGFFLTGITLLLLGLLLGQFGHAPTQPAVPVQEPAKGTPNNPQTEPLHRSGDGVAAL